MLRAPDLIGCALDDRYELLTPIGQGAFGWVYEARDRRLGRAVAVKVIKPWWAEDSEWVQRFEREAEMLARINDPGIVQIFDIGDADEGPYYVAELVRGESLAERLARGSLPAAEVVRIGAELARALASAHARGVVHCDVKPANILLTPEGAVKIGDFGVARLAQGTSQAPSLSVAGTPRYMAPEQARGGKTSPATDVYSTGIVLYEMLVGRPPFLAKSALEIALQHLEQPVPPLPASTPAVLRRTVARALAKDPAKRFRDGGALAAALGDCARRERASSRSKQAANLPPDDAGAGRARDMHGRADVPPTIDLKADPTLVAASARRPAPPSDPARVRRRSGGWRARRAGWLAGALALAAIAIAIFLLTRAGASTTVPELRGLPTGGVAARASRTHVHPTFSRRYAATAPGIAVAQDPLPGRRVAYGSTVRVVLSAGPPPVAVPDLLGLPSASAKSLLGHAGLRSAVTLVAQPGSSPGVVLGQVPSAAAVVRHGSTVALQVAEPPRWRVLTTFSGTQAGHSVPVSIRGARWRVSYDMNYTGTCLLLLVCMGPSAQARDLHTGASVAGFDLGQGTSQTHTFDTGPGTYVVDISGGTDSAEWSMTIEDYY